MNTEMQQSDVVKEGAYATAITLLASIAICATAGGLYRIVKTFM